MFQVLGFGEYLEEVYAAYEQHKVETAVIIYFLLSIYDFVTFSILMLTLTEMIEQDTVKGGKCTNGAEMTEEEALIEQQRMFAEARARMNGIATATVTATATTPKPPDAEPSLNC